MLMTLVSVYTGLIFTPMNYSKYFFLYFTRPAGGALAHLYLKMTLTIAKKAPDNEMTSGH